MQANHKPRENNRFGGTREGAANTTIFSITSDPLCVCAPTATPFFLRFPQDFGSLLSTLESAWEFTSLISHQSQWDWWWKEYKRPEAALTLVRTTLRHNLHSRSPYKHRQKLPSMGVSLRVIFTWLFSLSGLNFSTSLLVSPRRTLFISIHVCMWCWESNSGLCSTVRDQKL